MKINRREIPKLAVNWGDEPANGITNYSRRLGEDTSRYTGAGDHFGEENQILKAQMSQPQIQVLEI